MHLAPRFPNKGTANFYASLAGEPQPYTSNFQTGVPMYYTVPAGSGGTGTGIDLSGYSEGNIESYVDGLVQQAIAGLSGDGTVNSNIRYIRDLEGNITGAEIILSIFDSNTNQIQSLIEQIIYGANGDPTAYRGQSITGPAGLPGLTGGLSGLPGEYYSGTGAYNTPGEYPSGSLFNQPGEYPLPGSSPPSLTPGQQLAQERINDILRDMANDPSPFESGVDTMTDPWTYIDIFLSGEYQRTRDAIDRGIVEGVKDAVKGTIDTVTHPIDTAKGVVNAVAHPIDTANAIKESATQKAIEFWNADPERQGEMLGYGLGFGVTDIATGKGISTVVNKLKNISNFYRYVGESEAEVIKRTGKIPNVKASGELKEIYFTDRYYETSGRAKTYNQLPEKPVYRVEIDPSNVPDKPTFTRIEPEHNPQWGVGGGVESSTTKSISVDPSKIKKLKGAK